MPKPTDPDLYAVVKREADAKFLAPTSIYKSAWIVREYRKRGGTYAADGKPKGLTRWFKEKWSDLNRPNASSPTGFAPCGRARASVDGVYPLCRPAVRVSRATPKTIAQVDAKTVQVAKKNKQKVKHAGRVSFAKTKKKGKKMTNVYNGEADTHDR
jgi:hypothetical protein